MKLRAIAIASLWSFSVWADTVPVITGSPTNLLINPGTTATFNVTATGATSYQWRFNGVDIPAATNATLQISNAQGANCGYYMVVAKNAVGSVPSRLAYLSLDYTYGGSVPSGAGILPLSNTGNTYFQGDVETPYGSPVTPTNGAVQLVAGPELDQMQPIGAPVLYNSQAVPYRFYNGYFNAPNRSAATIAPGQTCYYSVIAKYTNNGTAYTQPSTIMRLAAGTNGFGAPSNFGLKFPAWWAGEGLEPISQGGSPTNQIRVVGETFSLTNSYYFYTDYGVPYGQWRKDGKAIPGATNFVTQGTLITSGTGTATLSFTNLQPGDAGIYDFVLYGNDWVIMPTITLSVQSTGGQGIFQKTQLSGTNFICDIAGAAGRNYRIQCSTNLLIWTDLITLSNATGIVSFTNSSPSSGARFYRSVLLP